MKILLDNSPQMIDEKSERFDHELWQLRTPLTGYKVTDRPYGLDNGCFREFKERQWLRLVEKARQDAPLFVCAPDIVGDARRTIELMHYFKSVMHGLPIALVLQDGIGNHSIPWEEIDAVFVGGSDAFKIAPEALNACQTARMMGKWVHVGRVNTASRVRNWLGLADSIDGSGISRYDHMLKDVIDMIDGKHVQLEMIA